MADAKTPSQFREAVQSEESIMSNTPVSTSRLLARRTTLVESLNDITRDVEARRAAFIATSTELDPKAEEVEKVLKGLELDRDVREATLAKLSTILDRKLVAERPVYHTEGSVVVPLANPNNHSYAIGKPALVTRVGEDRLASGIMYNADGSVESPAGHLPGLRTNPLTVVRHATREEIVNFVGTMSDNDVGVFLSRFGA